jgi:hypothetical protein
MSNKTLVMNIQAVLERMLTPEEHKFLSVATRRLRPKASHKSIPKSAKNKAA